MRPSSYLFTIAALFLLILAGCGTPGAPLPPSLELPTPATDLAAARKGNTVALSWSPSQRTTDKQNLRHPGVTRVCRVAGELSITQCTNVVAEIPPDKLPKPSNNDPRPKVFFEDTLPPSIQSPTAFATYAVEMMNRNGRSAGLSNQVRVPLAPTLPPATGVSTAVSAEGVTVSWISHAQPPNSPVLRFHYRLMRRPSGDGPFTLVEDVPLGPELQRVTDRGFQWEQSYEYKITSMTDVMENGQPMAQVEGPDSAVAAVTVHDTFPPDQVSGVQAVFSGAGQRPFIDLTWAPGTESDLAGYDVFRNEQGSAPVKINSEPVKAPAYRDEHVQPGHTYHYAVRAIDLRGNAGALSVETTETVPGLQ